VPDVVEGRRLSVLLIDDDRDLCALMQEYLEQHGCAVAVAHDGRAGLAAALEPGHDVVTLDVMLPILDGFEVLRQLRRRSIVPVVMLTARTAAEDRINGLEAGADDYLPKPFDLPVLLARVKGLIRRREWARGATGGPVRVGHSLVDFANLELRKGDAVTRLTLLEAMLLKLLVERRGQVVTKAEILEKVWNLNPDTETRAVDNFVMRLRRHLEEDAREPRLLQTVRGVGYRLSDEVSPRSRAE
jgi:DNA-binding response OmpR family regulator